MQKGYLCLILHSHLPFVRHPEYEEFLEEDWFYEAVIETYIPLILTLEKLLKEDIDFRLTFSFTPTLLSMFEDSLLQERCLRHINRLIELAHREIERTRWQEDFQRLAIMYLNRFCEAKDVFLRYNKNLINAFRNFWNRGKIEVITSTATHGYLPLMDVCLASVKAQVKVAVRHFERVFGRRPAGFWLPECGYQPGQDKILKEEGIRYFFVDSHGLLHGTPRPKYGVFAPVYCKGSGVACFGRDLESAKSVWSSIEGYPGDCSYREFYRDVGFDLEYEYIKPYLNPEGIRKNLGIKYYRITGGTSDKAVYIPERAKEKAIEHAGNFMFNRERQVEFLYDFMRKPPIIVSPYDTELFGHWWFEGPIWLEYLLRKINFDQKVFRMITPSEYLQENPRNQVITPSMSSWGWKGYSEIWLQGVNDWIYRHLHQASERMTELATTFVNTDGLLKRALNQALRELLLAQSSDWAFIMACGTHSDYAYKRTKEHILRFTKLYEDIKANSIDEEWLSDIESKDNIFSDIDYRVHQ